MATSEREERPHVAGGMSWRARAAAFSVAILTGIAPLVSGTAASNGRGRLVENKVWGYTLVLPADWRAAVDRYGQMQLSTYPVALSTPVDREPPAGQTRVWLYDSGPVSSLPSGQRAAAQLPSVLPAERGYEGFGTAARLYFASRGHAFLAFVKGAQRRAVLRIFGSIRLTARGRRVAAVTSTRVIGRSVQGRQLRASRVGNPRSHRRVLVVGCIHGNECAGMAITERLVNLAGSTTADIWVIQDLNPDGHAAHTRQNARGVDLNRNFGAMWQPIGRPGSWQYSGPRPFSEPETRAARALILRLRPAVTIWFHQPQGLVRAWGLSEPAARTFARLVGVRYRSLPWLAGSAPNWQNHLGLVSFVVELPPGPVALATADRYTLAILTLADPHR